MKNTKVTQGTREETDVVRITCDLCKRTIKGHSWAKSSASNVAESTVSLKTGFWFPDGGNGELVEFDICPDCFENRLVGALLQMGAEPTTTEWSC